MLEAGERLGSITDPPFPPGGPAVPAVADTDAETKLTDDATTAAAANPAE
jgi:hypothetical protein